MNFKARNLPTFPRPANFFPNLPTFFPNLPTFPKPANFYLKIWGGTLPPQIGIYRNPVNIAHLFFEKDIFIFNIDI